MVSYSSPARAGLFFVFALDYNTRFQKKRELAKKTAIYFFLKEKVNKKNFFFSH